MARLAHFDTPAYIQDLAADPAKQLRLIEHWSANINRWISAAQIGDVWDIFNYGPRPAFYNPLTTDTPASAIVAPISWSAWPGRIAAYFPDQSEYWSAWADDGVPVSYNITFNLCTQQPEQLPYTPTGPRGWQDEYCEWSVARDCASKITSVMFTCENPEYWLTLWQHDPQRVCELYRELANPAVQLEDLYLRDSSGQPVIDPSTGKAAYNPLNIWNSGTKTTASSGGAVHLTSTPNTLSSEYDLAAVATIPRIQNGQLVTDAAGLICCAHYGAAGRNSDPTIGQNVNFAINSSGRKGALGTLTNPPGLYMQTPDFNRFSNPQHPEDDPAQFWTVVRGKTRSVGEPLDRILHATYAVPESKGYTVSDIQIDGQNITYGSQIANTIKMMLAATVFEACGPNQQPVGCMASNPQPSLAAALLQDKAMFLAYRALEKASAVRLLSLPALALPVARGTTMHQVALLLNTQTTPAQTTISVDGSGIGIAITGCFAVDGIQAFVVSIAVASDAALGDLAIRISAPGYPPSPYPAQGLLYVVDTLSVP
jgi:hypothetical protein